MMLLKQVSHYSIVQQIGVGGMGEVYLGRDEYTGEYVAIKLLSKHLSMNPTFIDQFRREAELQSKLIHPNIVRLHSFTQESDNSFMVMEYIDGITLYKLITTTGGLTEKRTLRFMEQMLEGICYLHKKGILHRDINPRNFIVDVSDTVKIMDFGISKGFGELDFRSAI